jgi:cytochrome c oxidase subunit 2
LWIITILVSTLIITIILNKFINKIYYEFPMLELFWTVLPGIILIFIAFPSLELLYQIEEKNNQNLTVKITGHQWYWNYNYFNKINFDSYLESPNIYSPRILDTDNHLILPLGKILSIITSEDVLHRWRIPSIGVKIDARPGRLNSVIFSNFIPGIYYGHCSEICGANHRFIPIVLESVNFNLFKQWIINIFE